MSFFENMHNTVFRLHIKQVMVYIWLVEIELNRWLYV